jgi:hypothetical protein
VPRRHRDHVNDTQHNTLDPTPLSILFFVSCTLNPTPYPPYSPCHANLLMTSTTCLYFGRAREVHVQGREEEAERLKQQLSTQQDALDKGEQPSSDQSQTNDPIAMG